jgi:Aspartate/tyrosine/aromatic aminotransferase
MASAVGALSVVCKSAEEAGRVLGQLMSTVRANYSNPPTQARARRQRAVGCVLARFMGSGARHHARTDSRHARHDSRRPAGHVDEVMRARYVAQRGMFTYTGLSEAQVERLRSEYAVYVLRSGRMCVAGLNARNADYVASSIAAVVAGV